MVNKIASILHIPTHILRRFVLSVVIFLFITGGWLAYDRISQNKVMIIVDDQEWTVRTKAETVQIVLDEAQIDLGETDRIDPLPGEQIKDGMVIKIQRAHQLVLDIDGEISRLYTHEANILDILDENTIELGENDKLLINHQQIDPSLIPTLKESPWHVQIIRSKTYTINYHDDVVTGTTTAATVGDLLYKENVELYLADEVNLPLNTPLYDDIVINITGSTPVLVKIDGLDWHTRIIGSTVNDVLTELGLSLTGQDYTIPDEDDTFEDNMIIEIVRVVELIEVDHQAIPYEIIVVHDEALSPTEQKIIQAGEDGVEELRWRVRQENGEEVSRFLQSQLIVQEPIPEIVAVGAN